MRTWLIAFLMTLAAVVGINSGDEPFGIWCKVDGKKTQFTEDPKAGFTPEGGLWFRARFEKAWLSVSLPKARSGLQRLTDTLGLELTYVRDAFSSATKDTFLASASVSNAVVEVTLQRIDATNGIVEGTFSANVPSLSGNSIAHLTGGIIRLKLLGEPSTKGGFQLAPPAVDQSSPQ
jgi:hypothetical protein